MTIELAGFLDSHWRCGDCGRPHPKSFDRCTHPLDDYLSLRGGSIESAIQRAVDHAVTPLVERALRRLQPTGHGDPMTFRIRVTTRGRRDA